MNDTLTPLLRAQEPIKAAFASWLTDGRFDAQAITVLHEDAAVQAHRHYVATIPVYRQLADELGLVSADDAPTIWSELASTDELFKSYDPAWIDAGDFNAMSDWLGGIYNGPIPVPARSAHTIESWIAALGAEGTRVRFSSGTRGHLSFVARDERTDEAMLGHSVQQVMGSISETGLALPEYDGILLAFKGGNQGFAALAEKLGALTRSQTFLFDTAIDADLLRANVRGVATVGQEERFAAFRRDTVERLDEHLERIQNALAASAEAAHPVLLYAPPFQLMDLLDRLDTAARRIVLPASSMLMIGGGWKSFEDTRIPREQLLARVETTLGIAPGRATEGYGMSECNVLSNRCTEDRFHIPPVLHPILYDDALLPTGQSGRGRYGFSDPFASCYPGFVITGDGVELTTEPCACGRQGPSIRGEISRAKGHEVKGCGGVMASVRM
jgi:hypothetical protein